MRCPTCKQEIAAPTTDNCCPLCGASIGPVRQRVTLLYVVSGSIFASVLIYGAIVAIMESTGFASGAGAPDAIKYVFLGIALCMYVPIGFVERQLLARETAQAVWSAAIVVAALCESIAILGLVLYFLGEGVKWFSIFLGLSLVSFVYLASRMPTYAGLIEKYAAGTPQ